MWRAWINAAHEWLARRPIAVQLALSLRNQANCIVGYHLGETADGTQNGEYRLLQHVAPRVSRFMDCGANVGTWSETMRSLSSQAQGVLFEPSTQSLKKLEDKFKQDPSITLRPVALAAQLGQMDFFEEAGCGETSSLVPTFSHSNAIKISREVSTVDAECHRLGWEVVDFLKIDCEGYDGKVIEGARELLSRQGARLIQFEYNSPWAAAGSTLAATTMFLRNSGYEVFLLRSTGLHVLNYPRYGEYFHYSNFVALPPQSREWVAELIRSEF